MEKDKNKFKQIVLPENLPVCQNPAQLIADLEDGRYIRGLAMQDSTLQGADLSDLCFENVIFSHCTITETDWARCTFTNVLFESCALTNCDFSHCRLHRCELRNAQFKGADFSGSRLSHLRIQNSNLRYANLTESQLEQCEIVSSDLSDTFFSGCVFKQLTVSKSQFTRAEFFRTPLKGIDFTTCALDGICVSETGKELSGAIVTVFQAADLAKLLGIVIKDSD